MKNDFKEFSPLELETRTNLDTAAAAFHMNRRPQTMRMWACMENGPVRPMRINGRLAWPVIELRRALGCTNIGMTPPAVHGSVAVTTAKTGLET